MGRETTLRQLIYKCNKEILKEEGMTRSELHAVTNWVLNNAAVSKFSADDIYITDGSYIGVGENNKDRTLTLPRFMTYEFGKLDFFTFIENNKRNFKLKSYRSFEELETFLIYATTKVVVIIDGEIVEYERVGHNNWGWEVVWGKDTYIITYILNDYDEKEICKSKVQLKNRILWLIEEGAADIVAYNIVEGKSLEFVINRTIYSTKPSADDEPGLLWLSEQDFDDEEEEVF